jgi:hypothetical protein
MRCWPSRTATLTRESRALALSGLAVVADDPALAAEAAEAFARARAVTSAAGSSQTPAVC